MSPPIAASAPSIWWAKRRILAHARQLRDRQTRLSARLVLSAGEADTDSMLGDLRLLEQQLAAQTFDGLTVAPQRFPSRNHYDVLPESSRSGLRRLFG